ncbi:hypothetical protein ACH492_33160 [Streptomyces sp. NPDC019443]|uniref:hypothetical protein n=1 Tax=Streptomyces sp. NPDC019443 TaxID=3365061 RepID=UPI0037A6C19A
MSAPRPARPAPTTVQRRDNHTPPSTGPQPPVGPPPPGGHPQVGAPHANRAHPDAGSGAVGAAFDARHLTDGQVDELTHRLIGPLTRLLRTELRLDRERIGKLRDPRR